MKSSSYKLSKLIFFWWSDWRAQLFQWPQLGSIDPSIEIGGSLKDGGVGVNTRHYELLIDVINFD